MSSREHLLKHSPLRLTQETFIDAVNTLADRDVDLAAVLARNGLPPFWTRPATFATLILIILEQQVSLASARAAFNRLETATTSVTPESMLALDDEAMRAIGFSRQKMAYARGVAEAILEGRLDFIALENKPDAEAQTQLCQFKGIGPWTAQVYLLTAMRRADIWPVGDLALIVAMQEVKGLNHRPSAEEMHELATPWQPWRAAAARILWHHYLSNRA